jgi:ribosomal protein L37AE/L43A
MNDKNTKALWKEYPKIFPKNIRGHRVGFACGDGWYEHINALCGTIMLYCKDHNIEPPIVSDVKEKYGDLRFYVQSASIEVYDIIERFETESQYICEVCGERGKKRSFGGWYVTLCQIHFAERNRRYEEEANKWKRSKRN